MAPDAKEANLFTAREHELLAGALKCTKEEVKIDYAKFAQRLGFKNANSAKASWHGLKKKLDKMADGDTAEPNDDDDDAAAAGDKSGAKDHKKRKAADEGEDDAQLDTAPVKGGKRNGRQAPTKKRKSTPSAAGEGGEEETPLVGKGEEKDVKVEEEDQATEQA